MGWLPQVDPWAVAAVAALGALVVCAPALLELPRWAFLTGCHRRGAGSRAGGRRRPHRDARLDGDLRHRARRVVRGQERVLARAAGVVLRLALLPGPLRGAGAGGPGQRRGPPSRPAAVRAPHDADDPCALCGPVHRCRGGVRAVDLRLGTRARARRARRADRRPPGRRVARPAGVRRHVGRRRLRRAGHRGGGACSSGARGRRAAPARSCSRWPPSARGRCWRPARSPSWWRGSARAGGRLRGWPCCARSRSWCSTRGSPPPTAMTRSARCGRPRRCTATRWPRSAPTGSGCWARRSRGWSAPGWR